MNDQTSEEREDYVALKKKLAKEQGESYLKTYPNVPVDSEGQPIANSSTLEKGVKVIAGEGHKTPIHDHERITSQYGDMQQDWQKLTSEANQGIEVHGYYNQKTGEVVELKTKEVGPSSNESTEISSQTAYSMTNDANVEETRRNEAIENRRNERQQELKLMTQNGDEITKRDAKPDSKDETEQGQFQDNKIEITGDDEKSKPEIGEKFKENNKDIQGLNEKPNDDPDRPEPKLTPY